MSIMSDKLAANPETKLNTLTGCQKYFQGVKYRPEVNTSKLKYVNELMPTLAIHVKPSSNLKHSIAI